MRCLSMGSIAIGIIVQRFVSRRGGLLVERFAEAVHVVILL